MEEIESKINGLQEEYTCSSCGHKQVINIYPYINFNENPEYYEKVKSLEIFNVKCNQCHKESSIMYNMLLIDQTQKYFIYLLPNKDDLKYFENQVDYFMKKNFDKSKIPDYDQYKKRLVFNLNELIEKLSIFEYSLDDRALELLKGALIDDGYIKEKNVDIYFDRIDEVELIFIYFIKLSKEIKDVKLSISLYNAIIEKVKQIKNEDKFEIINIQWAKDLIKNIKKNK